MSEAYDVMLEQLPLPRQQPFEHVESVPDETSANIQNTPDISTETPEAIKLSQDHPTNYYQKIGRIPLLNAEQEVDLSKWIEAGLYARQKLNEMGENLTEQEQQERLELEKVEQIGEAARITMIESNLRLVVSVAKRYMGRGVPLNDLIQEGNMGLMHAVELFDYTKGFKFSTYAMWWIRRELSRAIDNQAELIYKPTLLAAKVRKVRHMNAESVAQSGRPLSDEELMSQLNTTKEKAKLWRELSKSVISLDHPTGDEGDDTFGNFIEDASSISPEAHVEHNGLLKTLDHCLSLLTEREVNILQMRYGLGGRVPMTLDQIGPYFGVTRERIRQIEFSAIKRIKTAVEQGRIPSPFNEAI